jgi:hypothetical protein
VTGKSEGRRSGEDRYNMALEVAGRQVVSGDSSGGVNIKWAGSTEPVRAATWLRLKEAASK